MSSGFSHIGVCQNATQFKSQLSVVMFSVTKHLLFIAKDRGLGRHTAVLNIYLAFRNNVRKVIPAHNNRCVCVSRRGISLTIKRRIPVCRSVQIKCVYSHILRADLFDCSSRQIMPVIEGHIRHFLSLNVVELPNIKVFIRKIKFKL